MNSKQKKPGQPGPKFQAAISLDDKEKVEEWLDEAKEKKKMLRLPVRIILRKDFPWSISEAFIGSDQDLIPIQLDDSRMGIPISDFLRQNCGQDKESCLIWLDGYFDLGLDSNQAFFVRAYVSKEKEPKSKRDWIWEAM